MHRYVLLKYLSITSDLSESPIIELYAAAMAKKQLQTIANPSVSRVAEFQLVLLTSFIIEEIGERQIVM